MSSNGVLRNIDEFWAHQHGLIAFQKKEKSISVNMLFSTFDFNIFDSKAIMTGLIIYVQIQYFLCTVRT